MNEYGRTGRAQSTGKRNARRRHMMLAGLLCLVLLAAAVLLLVQCGMVQAGAARIEGPPYVVALDAGHGGADVGATGVINEVEMTERTVQKLYTLLAADPDFAPVLCREIGEGAGPNERAAAAKQAGASMLFSVHGNADTNPQSNGFECYPVPPGRGWHAQSLRLAQLVAAEMKTIGARLRGEGGIRYLYYNTAQSSFIVEASDTAVYPQKSFGVLEQPDCVAILVEQCFVTNESDVGAFATEAGCALAAECYYRAIRAFYDGL